jgi:hypothetical protein
VRQITRAIDRAEVKGVMTPKRRKRLYQGLFFLLAGSPNLDRELREFCRKNRLHRALEWVIDCIGKEAKLPQALHARTTRHMSLRRVLSTWKVRKSDLAMVEQIAEIAGLDPRDEHHLLRRYHSSMELKWLGEVEAELEEVEVIMSRQALQDILLGVFETYKVPKSKSVPYSEVFGLCLGMASRQKVSKKGSGTRTKWFVHVEKAVPQIRAKASKESVLPNSKSIEAVIEAASSLFPQLEIIGDYHSHPYRNVRRLRQISGWEASPNDHIGIEELYRGLRTHPRRKHRLRVSFIVAIAKGRSIAAPPTHLQGKRNVVHMVVAGCHIYLSCYRILSNGKMTDSGVNLVPSMDAFHNYAV